MFWGKPQEQNRDGRWAQSGQYLNGLGRAITFELAPYIKTRFGVKPQEQNHEGRWAQSGQYLNGLGRAVTFSLDRWRAEIRGSLLASGSGLSCDQGRCGHGGSLLASRSWRGASRGPDGRGSLRLGSGSEVANSLCLAGGGGSLLISTSGTIAGTLVKEAIPFFDQAPVSVYAGKAVDPFFFLAPQLACA
ncbi:hypothetical protein ACLB2K_026649 [Fragaria x ananassa]